MKPVRARRSQCEICGERQVTALASKDRRGESLDTVVCTTCGLISHADIPTDEQTAAYYARQYRADYHGQHQPSPRRVLRAWHVGQSLTKRLRPLLRDGDRVFEIGAGLGCTVKAFEMAGYRASGIEPGNAFQAFARNTLRSDIDRARLEDLPPTPAYDFVLLVHVIEHFNHPARALNAIRNLLRPGGRLYVECPNAAAPHAAPGRMFHYAHIYNFAPWTLKMLAESCGFRLIHRLSTNDCRNLRFVFERKKSRPLVIDADSYRQTMKAVSRFNTLTYYGRPSYLQGRLRSLATRTAKGLFAKRRFARIASEIERHQETTESAPELRVAREAA